MGVVTYTTVEGEILSESRDGTRTDYVPNPLGSTAGLLDSSQNFVAKLTYWPYGEEVGTPYAGPQQMRYVGTLGCRKEGTSGRVGMRARVMIVLNSRFLQFDPLWPEEHAFSYALNNPTTYSDPSGLMTCEEVRDECIDRASVQQGLCQRRANNRYNYDRRLCKGVPVTHRRMCEAKALGKYVAALAACRANNAWRFALCQEQYEACITGRDAARRAVCFGFGAAIAYCIYQIGKDVIGACTGNPEVVLVP
ncbi:MAG: RHS repeat domain-containing protein [Fimbriimonadaceae bacterium]